MDSPTTNEKPEEHRIDELKSVFRKICSEVSSLAFFDAEKSLGGLGNELFQLIVANVRDVVFIQDLDLGFLYLSPSVEEVMGYTQHEGLQLEMEDIMTTASYAEALRSYGEEAPLYFQDSGARIPLMEFEYVRKDGSTFWGEIKAVVLFDSQQQAVALLGILRNIDERKSLQQRLEELSWRDGLTGLYNRNFFTEEMTRFADGRNASMGMIVCDIDGLKFVNDTMGHKKGDELIRASAEVLKSCFRKSDILARIGGDEFAVLLPGSDEETVKDAYRRIQNSIGNYNEQCSRLPLSISVGYATTDTSPFDMDALFAFADRRMYEDKMSRRQARFNP